jgi:hypothetical protein
MTRADFLATVLAGVTGKPEFYVAENPRYTIRDSMQDSLRFTLERTLVSYRGHLSSKSSFVNVDGEIMEWHDFGPLEGPGWAANAVGGAYEIYRFANFARDEKKRTIALSILDHVLEDGFLDSTGIIKGYRHTGKNEFVLNYKHNSAWFCPGSMAKIGVQLLFFSDLIPPGSRREKMRSAAVNCAAWIQRHVQLTNSGWFPRRCTVDGKGFPWRPGEKSLRGGDDPYFDGSADGLFIIQLMAGLTERRLANYRDAIRDRLAVFMNRGGIFGSINHDVYDGHENVAYAVAFRVLRQASALLTSAAVRRFAYERCLAGLEQFKMTEDRHGVATKGLLYMCQSWDTAYLWENAEASLAYLEAYRETRNRPYLSDGVTILRAIAKHHHGRYGFLTEGVDWNNHVSAKHHFDGAEFGAIRYTEPFLNNQHITEPTLFYLEELGAPAV